MRISCRFPLRAGRPQVVEKRGIAMVHPFHKILSPVDFSDENSLAALEYAAYVARQCDATVYLLYVIPADEAQLPRELYHRDKSGGADLAWAKKTVEEKLREIAQERLGGEIPYEILTRIGDDAATAVLEAAEALEAGLIVLATQGRAGLSRFLQGSVTEQVVRDSLCPVLAIRVSA
jgi:nucleotide-binding universal stress UspA family protein